jgi:hypothetical protein
VSIIVLHVTHLAVPVPQAPLETVGDGVKAAVRVCGETLRQYSPGYGFYGFYRYNMYKMYNMYNMYAIYEYMELLNPYIHTSFIY